MTRVSAAFYLCVPHLCRTRNKEGGPPVFAVREQFSQRGDPGSAPPKSAPAAQHRGEGVQVQELWQEVPHQTSSAAPVGLLFLHLTRCGVVLFNGLLFSRPALNVRLFCIHLISPAYISDTVLSFVGELMTMF